MSKIDMRGAMATNVHLTPELEAFARHCVEGGRYNNMSEVVRAGLRLLQSAEEAERNGAATLDDVLADMDTAIDVASWTIVLRPGFCATAWPMPPVAWADPRTLG
ncbi:conserved protein of unknown function, containing ribbon-helix-helix [Magnetospirillum gryphiswaldense MSR-1 v2]|uniref:Type II toxin-antitoxin system ParD family antitoxin n=1 Tax=Magnetospirillum gryphiswaldense (strain DSM 6361 / JCM 21280 / NBRC 15271 / MSR-1) TaxID=431944 RepID=V6EX19_MAGGM|nr:type II toxin-antitoxin system ParD family antitoxin [Magnetospirillum gryphiswaldense]CDK97780.1 conserved protein of unknown function, containing ribbon-helix-helix [Magnetospirillum gryphiswaldense MSR-1 v2]